MVPVPRTVAQLWRFAGDARLPAGSVLWSWAWHLSAMGAANGGHGISTSSRRSSSGSGRHRQQPPQPQPQPQPFVPPGAVMAFVDHLTLTVAKLAGRSPPREGGGDGGDGGDGDDDAALDTLALALEKLAFCATARFFRS